jgi:mannose-6-phosphate isomerase-like protein (cupin superfamily)
MHKAINLEDKFSQFSEHWAPRRIAQVNNYDVRIVKLKGEFVWHSHADTDELFYVLKGSLTIELRDGAVTLSAGEMYVVPRGVEHRPVAAEECEVMLFEPEDVVNTGAEDSDLQADVVEL